MEGADKFVSCGHSRNPKENLVRVFYNKPLKHYVDMSFDSVNVAAEIGRLSTYLAEKLKKFKSGTGSKAVNGPYGSQGLSIHSV